jgi:GntR family transcriptional regulator
VAEGMVRSDRRPLYEQVQAAVIGRIMTGAYRAGQQLPREDQLASSFGVSRTTLRAALGNLETLGYIQRVHGAGTFIAAQHFTVKAELATLETFHPRLAARMGLTSKITDLQIVEVPADAETAAAMALRPGDPVISIARTIEIDGVPVVYLEEFLPAGAVNLAGLQADFRDSVIDYLDGTEDRPRVEWSETDLCAARADHALAGRLAVQPGEALFRLDESLYDAAAQQVVWSRIHIVPEFFKFHVRRQILREETTAGAMGEDGDTPGNR